MTCPEPLVERVKENTLNNPPSAGQINVISTFNTNNFKRAFVNVSTLLF